jgi:uncharacterized paraquat-inducible protein A
MSYAGYGGPACPHCSTPLDVAQLISGAQSCPRCRRRFEAVRFDPPFPDLHVKRLSEAGPEGAPACANHAGNLAVTHCARCGIFMCALCRIEAEGQGLCPACFERLSDEGALRSAIATYRDYGRMSAMLAALGLLFPFVGPVSGPASIYYGWRSLDVMRSRGEEGGRLTVYIAMGVGALGAIGGVVVIALMVKSW